MKLFLLEWKKMLNNKKSIFFLFLLKSDIINRRNSLFSLNDPIITGRLFLFLLSQSNATFR